MTIYIGNLSYQVTEEDVREIFVEYGAVKSVSVPIDRETNKPRGFGFVEMETSEQEDAAISALDGAEWMGRQLRVNKAKPKTDDRGGRGDRRGGDSFRERRSKF